MNHVLLHSFAQIMDLLFTWPRDGCIAAPRAFCHSRPTDRSMTATTEFRNSNFEIGNFSHALRFFLRPHLFRNHSEVARHGLEHRDQTLRLGINQEQNFREQIVA